MAITYVKDIPDFNKKVNELTDITDVKDDIEDIQGDIEDIQGDITTLAGAVTALDEEVDGLSASNLPYSAEQSTKQKIDAVNESIPTKTSDLVNDSSFIKLYKNDWGTSITVPQSMCTLIAVGITTRGVQFYSYNSYNDTVTNISAAETLTSTKNNDNTVTFTTQTSGQISVFVM